MASADCCRASRTAARTPLRASRWRTLLRRTLLRRSAGTVGWIAPGVALALLPKCPLCLAGWIAAISGLGVSLSVAAWLRDGLWVAAALSLALLVWRVLVRPRNRGGGLP